MSGGADAVLAERISSCLPAASFELETLCRLAGVLSSDEIPTAAVECRARPRLLLNPDFVAEYCRRDEHLFLLVMHELWHVILAHTRLYPRVTLAHNVAFDAIINAGLARQHAGPEYRGFFETLNPADEFPGLLLRPPVGWPRNPEYPQGVGPAGTKRMLERLYPVDNPDGAEMPMYQEILDLLEKRALRSEPLLLGLHDDPLGDGGDEGDEGGEGAEATEQQAMDDPLFGGVVRRIVARWPPPPIPLAGRDAGRDADNWVTALHSPAHETLPVFARVLRRTLGRRPGSLTRRTRDTVVTTGGLGVLPSGRDRLQPARRALGAPSTLWAQPVTVRARVPHRPATAHIYLDVSGSMQSLLPHLCGLVAPYAERGQARVFQFSTEVAALPTAKLRSGKLSTTFGTDLRCVLEHALANRQLRRCLILTDGYVGDAPPNLAAELRARRIAIHAVLPSESAYLADLRPIARSLTVLPPLAPDRRSR